MKKDKYKTKVVFRKSPGEDSQVIALFPEIEENHNCIGSYMHLGQHAAASKDLIKEWPVANEPEYADPFTELESIGYNLEIISL